MGTTSLLRAVGARAAPDRPVLNPRQRKQLAVATRRGRTVGESGEDGAALHGYYILSDRRGQGATRTDTVRRRATWRSALQGCASGSSVGRVAAGGAGSFDRFDRTPRSDRFCRMCRRLLRQRPATAPSTTSAVRTQRKAGGKLREKGKKESQALTSAWADNPGVVCLLAVKKEHSNPTSKARLSSCEPPWTRARRRVNGVLG
jgi:hypothetical protein